MSARFSDDTFLAPFRAMGDPLADAAISELGASAGFDSAANFRAARDRASGGGLAARALLETARIVPPWVDFDRMAPGLHRSEAHTLLSGLCLLTGSLIESFATPEAALILIRSGKLCTEPRLRLYRTARFVHEIVTSGGAPPGTRAHENLLGVRLTHALVRGHVRRHGGWPAAWGCPLGQVATVSTLTMFSHVFTRSMARLGVMFTPAEWAAQQHTWRWVGHVLGIEAPLLPESVDAEAALYATLAAQRAPPDDNSRTLAHGLLNAMAMQPPFRLPLKALHALCRLNLGDALGDAFALQRPGPWQTAVSGFAAVTAHRSRLEARLPFAQLGARLLGRRLAHRILAGDPEARRA